MIELICMVLINMGGKEADPFLLEGTLITETSNSYIVDFSDNAKRRQLKGDYSRHRIEKFYCNKVNERLIA